MIVQGLRGREGLLIIDEAQHLLLPALESLRSIHDATACGLVLMGNEKPCRAIRQRWLSSGFFSKDVLRFLKKMSSGFFKGCAALFEEDWSALTCKFFALLRRCWR